MEQVSRVTLAVLGHGIAAVDTPIGDDSWGRNDPARNQCGAEGVDHLGVGHELTPAAAERRAGPPSSVHGSTRWPPASIQPTARGPSWTGFGNAPSWMY